MKRALIFLSISFLLFSFGCASHRQIVANELSIEAVRYVGKKTDELLLEKGPPDIKENLSTGEHLWTYRSTKAGPSKGWTITVGGNAPAGSNFRTWRENVNFIVSPEGVVKSYTVSVD